MSGRVGAWGQTQTSRHGEGVAAIPEGGGAMCATEDGLKRGIGSGYPSSVSHSRTETTTGANPAGA